jgi:hypothetical protein
MPKSYNGKILRVDLTTKKLRVEEPGEVFYRTYLGGGGLGSQGRGPNKGEAGRTEPVLGGRVY